MNRVFKYESPFGQEFDFEAIVKHDRITRDGNGKLVGYIISENGNKYNVDEISFPSPLRFAIKKGERIETKLSVKEFISKHDLESYVLFHENKSSLMEIDGVRVEVIKENDSLICIIQN